MQLTQSNAATNAVEIFPGLTMTPAAAWLFLGFVAVFVVSYAYGKIKKDTDAFSLAVLVPSSLFAIGLVLTLLFSAVKTIWVTM